MLVLSQASNTDFLRCAKQVRVIDVGWQGWLFKTFPKETGSQPQALFTASSATGALHRSSSFGITVSLETKETQAAHLVWHDTGKIILMQPCHIQISKTSEFRRNLPLEFVGAHSELF
jgi:hypothetical protein